MIFSSTDLFGIRYNDLKRRITSYSASSQFAIIAFPRAVDIPNLI